MSKSSVINNTQRQAKSKSRNNNQICLLILLISTLAILINLPDTCRGNPPMPGLDGYQRDSNSIPKRSKNTTRTSDTSFNSNLTDFSQLSKILDRNTISSLLKQANDTSSRSPSKGWEKLRRFSYDISSTPHSSINSSHAKYYLLKNVSIGDNATDLINNTSMSSGDLTYSDSRFVPQSISSSRYDEDFDSYTQDDPSTDSSSDLSSDGADPFSESLSASSNLNEQRAVRELKKILSKGLSTAVDPVKLETLEDWKRRQKERRLVKEKRAKLFEDLLTTAIESHPERENNKNEYSDNKTRDEPVRSASSSAGSSKPDVDPELMGDAELVMQHLQGLANVIDHHSPSHWSNEQDHGNPNDDSGPISQSSDSSGSSSHTSSDEDSGKDKRRPTPDRYIVKRFKKFKQSISQRRKQLEHIKKMFNVELALNAKDGSLVGKSTDHKKTKDATGIDAGDYTVIDDSTISEGPNSSMSPATNRGRRKSGVRSQVKMRELRKYLLDNPEILASVMAELTVDADPTSNRDGRDPDDDTSRHSRYAERSHHNRKPRLSGRTYDAEQESGINRHWRHHKLHDRSSSIEKLPLNHGRAELTLIQSLRDRQLLNLARLENILAEKQGLNRSQLAYQRMHPQSSNDDRIYSSDREPIKPSPDTHWRANKTGEEHHFLYVNQKPPDVPISKVLNTEPEYRPPFNTPITQSNYDSQHNSATTSNQASRYVGSNAGPRSMSQPNPQTLNRFKEWRDVSHTEIGNSIQQRSDGQNTSIPTYQQTYDLSTGSSYAAPRDTGGSRLYPSSSTNPAMTNSLGTPQGMNNDRVSQTLARPVDNLIQPGLQGADTQMYRNPMMSQGFINRNIPDSMVNRQNGILPTSQLQMQDPLTSMAAFGNPVDSGGWPLVPTLFMSRSSAMQNEQQGGRSISPLSSSSPAATMMKPPSNLETSTNSDSDRESIEKVNYGKRQDRRDSNLGRSQVETTQSKEKSSESSTSLNENPLQARDASFWIDEQPNGKMSARPIANYFQAYKDEVGPVSQLESNSKLSRQSVSTSSSRITSKMKPTMEESLDLRSFPETDDFMDEAGAMWAKS